MSLHLFKSHSLDQKFLRQLISSKTNLLRSIWRALHLTKSNKWRKWFLRKDFHSNGFLGKSISKTSCFPSSCDFLFYISGGVFHCQRKKVIFSVTTEKQNSCAEKENCVNKNGKNERKTKAFKKEKVKNKITRKSRLRISIEMPAFCYGFAYFFAEMERSRFLPFYWVFLLAQNTRNCC